MHFKFPFAVALSILSLSACSNQEFASGSGKIKPVRPNDFAFTSPTGAINDPTPTVQWTEASSAASYDVSVARDAQCKEVVQAHARVLTTSVQLDQLADGIYHLCGVAGSAIGGTRQASNDGFSFVIDTTPPIAEISGTPAGASQVLHLIAKISGQDVVGFKHKIVVNKIDCATPEDWSEAKNIDQPLVLDLANIPDGPVVVCAVGRDDLQNWQTYESATVATWEKASGAVQVKLVTDNIVTNIDVDHAVEGLITSSQEIGTYAFLISNSSGEVLFKSGGDLSSKMTNEPVKALVELALPEDRLKVELLAYDELGRVIAQDQRYWTIDLTPPNFQIISGVKMLTDPCTNPPQSRLNVASKLLPVAYCGRDPGKFPSGVAKACVNFVGGSSMPPLTDACWVDVADLQKQALLQIGPNTLTGWVVDAAGNTGDTSIVVTLNLGEPPFIDILAPSSATIAAAPWARGQTKTIKWKVKDNDTPFEDIKVAVLLVEATNLTSFQHLACNFANSPLWNQCPSVTLENSPLLKKYPDDQTMDFSFTVPNSWDQNKQYLIVITAIDQSGNASVASTQEINVQHEVLAGRTYKGVGGSGVTLQRALKTGQWLVVDEWGTLYDITNNIKIDTFDYRTCRMSRKTTQAAEPFDCADILVTDYELQQSKWQLDKKAGVFFAYSKTAGENYILRIDPKARTVLPIFGGTSKAVLSSALTGGSSASSYRSTTMSSRLFFDAVKRRLLFRASSQLFSIDDNGNVKWQMGALGGTTWPADGSAKAKSILLPDGDAPFALSKNGTLLIGGLKLTTTPNGGGLGRQYVYSGFEYDNPEKMLANISITKTERGAYTDGDSGTINDLEYDPAADRFYGSLAWWGYFRMRVPAPSTLATAYNWQIMVQYSATIDDMEANVLAADQANATLPRKIYAYSHGLALAGGNLLYFSNDYTGTILLLDMTNWRIDPVIGFMMGKEPDQSGVNRRLDMPLYMAFDGAGDLLFDDFYNLQKIKLSSAGNANPLITTLANHNLFDYTPFVFNGNKIYQVTATGLKIYNYPALDLSPQVLTIATNSQPQYYQLQFGLGNNLTRIKSAHLTSLFDPVMGTVFKTLLVGADMGLTSAWPAGSATIGTETLLSVADQYSLDLSYCGGGSCVQGASIGTSPKYFNGADYRLTGVSGNYANHNDVGVLAFNSNDSEIYTCLNDHFIVQELTTNRVYEYVVNDGATTMTCKYNTSVFRNFGGEIYFAKGDGIYKLDVSHVKSNNTATATRIAVAGAYVKGSYGDFLVTSTWVYYTDKTSHRVIRSKRIP